MRPVVPPRLTGFAWIGSRLAHLAGKPRMLLSHKLDAHCRESVSVSLIRCRWRSPDPFELRLWLGLTVPYIKSVPTGPVSVTVLFIFVQMLCVLVCVCYVSAKPATRWRASSLLRQLSPPRCSARSVVVLSPHTSGFYSPRLSSYFEGCSIGQGLL